MSDIDHLTSLLEAIPYPPGIQKVIPGRIERAAFFPGGSGILVGDDPKTMQNGDNLPRGGVMVLGHNFHNISNYEKTVEAGGEIDRNETWRRLLLLLHECGIRAADCFFTNALQGLIESDSAVGSHPGHREPAFRSACRHLFETSVSLQRPRLILALGKPVMHFLGEIVPGLATWAEKQSFSAFDRHGRSKDGLGLPWPGPKDRISIVALVHPCMRGSNLRHRRYNGVDKERAELAMVHDAMRASRMLG